MTSDVITPGEGSVYARAARWLIPLVLLIFYGNMLLGGFSFDDDFVLERAPIHRSGQCSPRCWFPPDYYPASGERSYRPAVTLTYFLQGRMSQVLGGAPFSSPFPFKLGNWLLHLCAAMLLWRVALRLFPPPAALFAALVFAVHPATTEAVNAVGFREDILAAVFLLASALLYLQWCSAPRRGLLLAGSLACFVLGLLSKENAYVFPLVLTATMAGWEDRPRRVHGAMGILAMIVLAALLGWLLLDVFRNPVKVPFPWLDGYRHSHVLLVGPLMAAHLRTLLVPHPLVADRTFLAVEQGEKAWLVTQTVFVAAVLLMLIWWAWRRDKRTFAALAWILLPLAPVSGVVRLTSPLADRFLYVSCVGMGLLMARVGEKAVAGVRSRHPSSRAIQPRSLVLAAALVVLALGAATLGRNVIWCTDELLWTTTLRQNPRSARAHVNVGAWLIREGYPAEAIPYLERGCQLETRDSRYPLNLALAYANTGQLRLALETGKTAIRPDLQQPSLFLMLARIALDLPDAAPEEAADYYRRARRAGAAPDAVIEQRLRDAGVDARSGDES